MSVHNLDRFKENKHFVIRDMGYGVLFNNDVMRSRLIIDLMAELLTPKPANEKGTEK